MPIRSLRIAIRWELFLTMAMTAIAGWVSGMHGALSAAMGGLVSIAASLGFLFVASLHREASPGGALMVAFRAEAAKVLLIVLLLWLVLATYKDVVVVWFIGAFAIAVLTFAMAAFVREE